MLSSVVTNGKQKETSTLRPWGTSRIVVSDLPAKLANPDYSWRWLGHLTNADR